MLLCSSGKALSRKLACAVVVSMTVAVVTYTWQRRVVIDTSAKLSPRNFPAARPANNSNATLCAAPQSGYRTMPNLEMRTTRTDWSFTSRVKCPPFNVTRPRRQRPKISLNCENEAATLVSSWTESSDDIFSIPFGDPCLTSAIGRYCADYRLVPNVAHYVWYENKTMGFFQFLSFMSVLRFMKPCLILIHGNFVPRGLYWDYFISLTPNVIHVRRERPLAIFGHNLAFPEHGSDVMRIEALKEYGGVYLDWDQVLLTSVEPLRQYDCTMGHEEANSLSCAFVMAKRNATFLQEWYHGYRDDYRAHWTWNSLMIPYTLSKEKPELIHVDGYNFTRPNYRELDKQFKYNFDWSINYAMHFYVRFYTNVTDEKLIRSLNTTVGSVSRHVLLGDKELCVE